MCMSGITVFGYAFGHVCNYLELQASTESSILLGHKPPIVHLLEHKINKLLSFIV